MQGKKGHMLALLYLKNNTKHINTVRKQNTVLLNVKACDAYGYHCPVKNQHDLNRNMCTYHESPHTKLLCYGLQFSKFMLYFLY
jgi:hypothetical protein